MNRITICIAAAFAVAVTGACGEPDEPLPFDERCHEEELKAAASGQIDGDYGTASFELTTRDETPGRILHNEIRLELGVASPPHTASNEPVILRLFDADAPADFPRHLGDLTEDGPVELEVFDASDLPPGQADTTSLSHLDCTTTEGTICAQLGYDSAGDGILYDDDQYVFNAIGGTVTLDGYDNRSVTFAGHWNLEFGPNVRTHDDDSSGEVDGCFRPRYDIEPEYRPLF